MMGGIHLFNHRALLAHTCGWIMSRFSHTSISNTEHHCFISILQSFATFWWPGYKPSYRKILGDDHPGAL